MRKSVNHLPYPAFLNLKPALCWISSWCRSPHTMNQSEYVHYGLSSDCSANREIRRGGSPPSLYLYSLPGVYFYPPLHHLLCELMIKVPVPTVLYSSRAPLAAHLALEIRCAYFLSSRIRTRRPPRPDEWGLPEPLGLPCGGPGVEMGRR